MPVTTHVPVAPRAVLDTNSVLSALVFPGGRLARLPAKPPHTPECRDPADRPFLELAVAGRADYLVSGDRDLLSIEGPFTCPIVTPQTFLEHLEK